MTQKIKENFHFIVLAFLILIFFRQCGVNRETDKIHKEYVEIRTEIAATNSKIDSINNSIKEEISEINTLTKEEMRKEMTVVMFEFLIYEDDFDHKRISLSEIKEKIKKNGK